MTTPIRRLAAIASVGAVIALSACSTPLESGPPTTTTAPPTTTTIVGASTPAQTKASDYRAQLTYLMVEHDYLVARVTQEIIAAGGAGGHHPLQLLRCVRRIGDHGRRLGDHDDQRGLGGRDKRHRHRHHRDDDQRHDHPRGAGGRRHHRDWWHDYHDPAGDRHRRRPPRPRRPG